MNNSYWADEYLRHDTHGQKNHCDNCGKTIKYVYSWDNLNLGIQCLRHIALPVLTEQWSKERREVALEDYLKDFVIVETLRQKNLSRIKNQFKLNFIPSVIAFFDQHHFITEKQKVIIHGTGEWNGYGHDYGLINGQKDHDHYMTLARQYKLIETDIQIGG